MPTVNSKPTVNEISKAFSKELKESVGDKALADPAALKTKAAPPTIVAKLLISLLFEA